MSDYNRDAALDQIAEWEEERRCEQWLENDYDEYNRSIDEYNRNMIENEKEEIEKPLAEEKNEKEEIEKPWAEEENDDVYTDETTDDEDLDEKIDRLWIQADIKEWETYKKTQAIVFDELEKVDKVVVNCSDIPDSNPTKSCCKYNIVNRRNTILEPIEEIHSETTSTQPNAQEFTVFDRLNFVKDYVIEFWSWLFSYKI
jgi:hypothetical protein